VSDQEIFEANRELLFAVAYRMLGTVADAGDAVQDAWLRWSAASRSDLTQPRAYLVRIITHIALNRLPAARARREAYVGPWLPEPLLTTTGPDTAERAELAESVSLAMLVVLESLTPEERAVFVLHEVFGFGLNEIAAAGGDIDELMLVLAPDVTLITDGGGKARAALRPITGAAKVARFLAAISARPYLGIDVSDMAVDLAEINGSLGTLITAGGRPIAAVTTVVAGGRITAIQLVANPDKLRGITAGRTLPL
jgi:RNA polymerase sigma-70 factor (ECF subfamily)